MKNSLSLYVQSTIKIDEEKESIELGLYLDSLLERYKPDSYNINEGLFDFLKRDNSRKSFFGGLFASWGFGEKSKTQQAIEKMYEDNANRAKERAKKLQEALEDARIAKMQAKNAARQSMLDQTNNKKIQDLKNLKAKYDTEAKKWEKHAKDCRTYTEAEIMAENKRLEEMSTMIPPEEKGTIEAMRLARINCYFDENGDPRSEEDTKDLLKKMQNDPQFKGFIEDCIKEANKVVDGEDDNKTWDEVYKILEKQVREDVGYSVEIEESEANLRQAENDLQAYNGNLTKEEASATDKYLKERKERALAKLQTGEDLDDDDKAALKSLTKQDLSDLGITEDDYKDLDIKETDSSGINCSNINQEKLKTKVKASKEKKQEEALNSKIDEQFSVSVPPQSITYSDFVSKLKKIGVPVDKIPSEVAFNDLGVVDGKLTLTSEKLTELKNDNGVLTTCKIEAAKVAAQKEAEKTTSKDAPKVPAGIDPARVQTYAERKMQGDDPEQKKKLEAAVEKQKTLVEQKKGFKGQIKDMHQQRASMILNQKLYDEVKVDDKSMREYLDSQTPLDPGEVEKDGKRGIYVGDKFIERPTDPDKMDEYDKKRINVVALSPEISGDDGKHVRMATNKDGKAVAVITDKDGNESEIDLSNPKSVSEDDAKEIARIMNEQKARESYKSEREEIFKKLAKNAASDELSDEQKELIKQLPEDFDTDSLEDLGLSKEDIKNIKDVKTKASSDKETNDDETEEETKNSTLDDTDMEDEAGDEENKIKQDPRKVWKQKIYKRGDKTYKTKSYYNKKGDSISADEFKQRIQNYEKRKIDTNSLKLSLHDFISCICEDTQQFSINLSKYLMNTLKK